MRWKVIYLEWGEERWVRTNCEEGRGFGGARRTQLSRARTRRDAPELAARLVLGHVTEDEEVAERRVLHDEAAQRNGHEQGRDYHVGVRHQQRQQQLGYDRAVWDDRLGSGDARLDPCKFEERYHPQKKKRRRGEADHEELHEVVPRRGDVGADLQGEAEN